MQNLIQRLSDYLRMIKFSHSLFALPFAGVALVELLYYDHSIIERTDFIRMLIGLLVCMVSMRSAAMGFNRIVDFEFDAANPRTANRELPAGVISISSAVFFVVLSLVFFVAAAFLIQPLAGWLSPIAILVTLGYSLTKRFTYLCHLVLGIALGLVPPAVWIVVTGRIEIEPILWMSGVAFYTAGFDILYASQDIDFDNQHGLKSIPARFGLDRGFIVARVFHILSFSSFISVSWLAETGLLFAITLLVVAGLFLLQHRLVSGGRLDRIPIAFFHVNASISAAIFFGLLIDRFLLPIQLIY
ncbi:MAG: UbiA family prenyltransferase [Leptonema sp. (in: Bacteria)]|nr:UbiA family prenyltransferase [Leptonema sp. (in: bacteria)]